MDDGLEVWKVNIEQIIEQDLNARAMSKNTFLQLVENIKTRGSFESLPLCAITDRGLELISGHHRVRAARKAEIETVWILVDVTNIARSNLLSKQLSHNSLQGKDNDDLVAQIFSQIGDAEARIAAYIGVDISGLEIKVDLASKDFDISLDTKTVTLLFLPLQAEMFDKAVSKLDMLNPDQVYLATKDDYDTFLAATNMAGVQYNIKSVPTLLTKMSEIVLEHIAKDEEGNKEEAKEKISEKKTV